MDWRVGQRGSRETSEEAAAIIQVKDSEILYKVVEAEGKRSGWIDEMIQETKPGKCMYRKQKKKPKVKDTYS